MCWFVGGDCFERGGCWDKGYWVVVEVGVEGVFLLEGDFIFWVVEWVDGGGGSGFWWWWYFLWFVRGEGVCEDEGESEDEELRCKVKKVWFLIFV